MDLTVKKYHASTKVEVVGSPFVSTVLSTKNFFIRTYIHTNDMLVHEKK